MVRIPKMKTTAIMIPKIIVLVLVLPMPNPYGRKKRNLNVCKFSKYYEDILWLTLTLYKFFQISK